MNPRPSRWQRDALPLSYARIVIIITRQFFKNKHYKVLKSINFEKHKPRLICIEILEKSEDKNEIFNFMEEKNYKFIKTCNVSYFFGRNESN